MKAYDIKRGVVLEHEGKIWQVKDVERSAPQGRGGNTTYRVIMYSVPGNVKLDISLRAEDDMHEVELTRRFLVGLGEVPGVRTFGPTGAERKVGITLFNFAALDPADVGRILDRRFGVMVRTGLHCSALAHRKLGTEERGAVRFSFGCFNTAADVDQAVAALHQIARAAIASR